MGCWGGGGKMKLKKLRLLSLQMLHTKIGKDWLRRSQEDVITLRRLTLACGLDQPMPDQVDIITSGFHQKSITVL